MYLKSEREGEETVWKVHFYYPRRIMTMIEETGRESSVRIKYTR